MRKYLFFFLIFTVQSSFAFDNKDNVLYQAILMVGRTITNAWTPFYNQQTCSKETLEKECKIVFSGPEYKYEDWKQYSASCSRNNTLSTNLVDMIVDCYSDTKEIRASIGESFMIQEFTQQELADCNASTDKKNELLQNYNKKVPRILQFKVDPIIDLSALNCLGIQAQVNQYYQTTMQNWITRLFLHANAKTMELTKDEKQFKRWLELEFARTMLSALDDDVLNRLSNKVNSFNCYNDYYKSKLFCGALSLGTKNLGKVDKLAQSSKELLKQDPILRSIASDSTKDSSKPRFIHNTNYHDREPLFKKINNLEKDNEIDMTYFEN